EGGVGGVVDRAGLPGQAVVEEAGGQLQEEVAAQGSEGGLGAEVVIAEAVEGGVADFVGIPGPGRDAGGLGAEGLTAGAGGAILGGGEVDDDNRLVGEGGEGAAGQMLAGGRPPARRGRRGVRG